MLETDSTDYVLHLSKGTRDKNRNKDDNSYKQNNNDNKLLFSTANTRIVFGINTTLSLNKDEKGKH